MLYAKPLQILRPSANASQTSSCQFCYFFLQGICILFLRCQTFRLELDAHHLNCTYVSIRVLQKQLWLKGKTPLTDILKRNGRFQTVLLIYSRMVQSLTILRAFSTNLRLFWMFFQDDVLILFLDLTSNDLKCYFSFSLWRNTECNEWILLESTVSCCYSRSR